MGVGGMSSDLSADVATADVFAAVVDIEGTIWVRLDNDQWTYIVHTPAKLSWDVHGALPERYAPYRPVDAAGTALILSSVAA